MAAMVEEHYGCGDGSGCRERVAAAAVVVVDDYVEHTLAVVDEADEVDEVDVGDDADSAACCGVAQRRSHSRLHPRPLRLPPLPPPTRAVCGDYCYSHVVVVVVVAAAVAAAGAVCIAC